MSMRDTKYPREIIDSLSLIMAGASIPAILLPALKQQASAAVAVVAVGSIVAGRGIYTLIRSAKSSWF